MGLLWDSVVNKHPSWNVSDGSPNDEQLRVIFRKLRDIRNLDFDEYRIGKLMLYQLSYIRIENGNSSYSRNLLLIDLIPPLGDDGNLVVLWDFRGTLQAVIYRNHPQR